MGLNYHRANTVWDRRKVGTPHEQKINVHFADLCPKKKITICSANIFAKFIAPKLYHLFVISLSVSKVIQYIKRHSTKGKILCSLFKVTPAVQVYLWKPSDTRFLFLWSSNKNKPTRIQVRKHNHCLFSVKSF